MTAGSSDDRAAALPVKQVGRRRVSTAPTPGSDAEPQSAAVVQPHLRASVADEDTAAAWGDSPDDNESRLKDDVPPHY
ncbi:hypothetical protein B7R54_12505 [Subtercola boreus]|uniref:Uncharacterized protein n=1 Tax=Subtercola boreus TaxID=120213 RepID=A0A3E0VJN6_9MICO|nr:hypothetical protein B7R54_12505 [Subtercola boreus]TQL52930.1 hypothetical protein FB464_0420 [Subtercola boreus]